MKAKSIGYRETVTFGDYQNATVEIHADLDPEELVEHAIGNLKRAVQAQLTRRVSEHDDERDRRSRSYDLERQLELIEADIQNKREELDLLKKRVIDAQAFLERHGIKSDLTEDIPF